MVTMQELVQFIDDRIRQLLDRPQMYASNPGELEAVLSALDEIRDFVLHGPLSGSVTDRGYTRFLVEMGFGALSFASAQRMSGDQALNREDQFGPLCAFWEDYLTVRGAANTTALTCVFVASGQAG